MIDIIRTQSSTARAVCGTDTLSSDGKPPCDTYSLAKNLGNEGLTDHSTQSLMTKGETSAQDTGSHQASSLKLVRSGAYAQMFDSVRQEDKGEK